MYLRRLFAALQCAGICCLALTALVCLTSSAVSKTIKNGIISAEIKLLNGKTMTLTAPITLKGTYTTVDYTITRLNIRVIESFAPLGQGKLILVRRGTDQRLELTPHKSARISGKSEWGNERVPLRTVASVTLHHAAKENAPPAKKAGGNASPAIAPITRRSPETRRARARRNAPKKPNWSVTFISGARLAFHWSGSRRRNTQFSGTVGQGRLTLYPKYIKHLTFREGNANIADVFDASGAIVTAGWRPGKKQFSATTSFGAIKSRWSSIQSLTNDAPEAAPATGARIRLTTTKKSTFVLSKLNERTLRGKLSGLSFGLDLTRVTRVARSKENTKHLVVSFANGRTFEKFEPTQSKYTKKSFSGTHKAGSLKIPLDAIETIEFLDNASRKKPVFQASWVVKTRQGLNLPVKGLRFVQAKTRAGGIRVKSVIWKNVASITPEENGLSLHFANGDALPVLGRVYAKSIYGDVTLSSADIASLVRDERAAFRKSPVSKNNVAPLGQLTLRSGARISVNKLTFSGGARAATRKRLWGYKFFKTRAQGHEFLVLAKDVLKNGFRVDKGRLLIQHRLLAGDLAVRNIRGVDFSNSSGKFFASVRSLDRFEPASENQQQMQTGTTKKFKAGKAKAAYKITAFRNGVAGTSLTVTNLFFARYPARAWSGSYLVRLFPFRWHKSRTLFFKRKDNKARVDIGFDKIASIVMAGKYSRTRRATIIGRTGNELEGTVYPGAVTKRYPGVSTWKSSEEGLMGKIANDLYVLIRFNSAERIDIEQL